MRTVSFDQLRGDAAEVLRQVTSHPDFDLMVVGSLLIIVVLLSLITIWRGRARQSIARMPAPSQASGFRRWLTPMGMQSIPAEQSVVGRPRRRSGSNKTIRVTTPVSKVATRALKATGADPLEIARRTGLARDAVVMMMANADPRAHAAKAAANTAASDRASHTGTRRSTQTAPSRAPARNAATERAMTAPGAYSNAPRTQPSNAQRTVGTQFNARVG